MEGKIEAILAGPNCRSRSILRHVPVPGRPDAPRPIRAWGGGEFGMEGITEEEWNIIYEDDVMLWRFWFLFIVSQQVRKAMGYPSDVKVAMEHPASPKEYNDSVVSWWDTVEWQSMKKEHNLTEVTFTQGSLGGDAVKPTTVGGSMRLSVEEFQTGKNLRRRGVLTSKKLARWAPGMMRMMASSLYEAMYGRVATIKALSWEEHLAYNHTPYRRDCRVCQESLQQVEPHRRIRHPQSAVLSVDVAGPLIPAVDQARRKSSEVDVGWRADLEVSEERWEADIG